MRFRPVRSVNKIVLVLRPKRIETNNRNLVLMCAALESWRTLSYLTEYPDPVFVQEPPTFCARRVPVKLWEDRVDIYEKTMTSEHLLCTAYISNNGAVQLGEEVWASDLQIEV